MSPLANPIIVRGIGGFYDVLTPDGRMIRCQLRGKLRLSHDRILVGDWVELSELDCGNGVIEEVLPRRNQLIRPAIANIDQAVVVLAFSDPKPDWLFLDRLLALIEASKLHTVICINKRDLLDQPDQYREPISVYERIGYRVVATSTIENKGIDELRSMLKDKVSVFTGPSGVGKSSLLNRIESGLELPVGSISRKLKRGRHTTKQVELIRLTEGGLVADTPGFSQLSLKDVGKESLSILFPEMRAAASQCRFGGCLHFKEPDCAVRMLVESGKIAPSRYRNYLTLLAEIEQAR